MEITEMGCSTSSSNPTTDDDQHQQATEALPNNRTKPITEITMKPTETMIEAFQRLDEDICRMESECIGPRLTTSEAWIEHLESNALKITPIDPVIVGISNTADVKVDGDDNIIYENINLPNAESTDERGDNIKVCHLAIKLGVAFNIQNAAKQEEFMAGISRHSMEEESRMFRKDILNHAKTRANKLLYQYNKLRILYSEEDNLIISISGGTYNSDFEQKLDTELDSLRAVRDKLGGVAEQWRTSALFLRACAKSALHACEYWNLVGPSKDATERINLAMDCRTACHGSLTSLESAQSALPQVEIPFISIRQASAVKHAIIYLLTDMANEARYRHTSQVLDVFQINATKAVEWLHNTYNVTLKKDLDDANSNVQGIAKRLRFERVRYMTEKIGDKLYLQKPTIVD